MPRVEANWPLLPEEPTDASGSERPTERGRRTETALKSAARDVISRRGFVQAGIAEIAAEAGCATGSFYTYFPTKEDLLGSLAEDFARDIQRRLAAVQVEGKSAREVMEGLTRAWWSACRENSAALGGVFQMAAISPRFAAVWRDIRAQGRAQFASSIEAAKRHGACPDLDVPAGASALASMFDYFAYVWLVEGGDGPRPGRLEDDTAVATLTHIWVQTLSGSFGDLNAGSVRDRKERGGRA